ncbi:hypothetical protein ABIF96_005788 [Bradyrhizobium ottawaense]|uniref:hypothetical protein n=1 Tax=Bradyrhizobium ottawaense TaxID=931866 RepID=UPI003838C1E7
MSEEPKPSGRGGKRPGAGRKPNGSDIAALVEALRPIKVGRDGYQKLDRYRDARAVFTSEAGKRILSQLIDLCEGPVIREHEIDNHAKLAYRQGMRFVGIQVLAWMNDIPSDITPDERIG